MTPLDVLQGAKNVLLEKGWTQHHYRDDDGYCSVGAIREAMGWWNLEYLEGADAFGFMEIINTATDFIRVETTKQGFTHVPSWNDLNGRTFGDVMEIFDAAILAAKQAEADAA